MEFTTHWRKAEFVTNGIKKNKTIPRGVFGCLQKPRNSYPRRGNISLLLNCQVKEKNSGHRDTVYLGEIHQILLEAESGPESPNK